jgi:Gpi18-like mannosyltransferase
MESLAIYLLVALAILWYAFDFVSQKRTIALNRVWILLAFALLIRVLAAILWGKGDPFDIQTWGMLARSVLERQNAYIDPALVGVPPRLPWLPFQLYLFALSDLAARALSVPFVTAVKIIPILADVGITALVFYGALKLSNDAHLAWRMGILYALNPLAIFDVSIHGQFDSIPLLFALGAWYIFQFQKPRKFNAALAGILLGFGILAKTWPLIFVPVLMIHAADWRKRASIAFFAGAVPIVGVLVYAVIFSANPLQVLSTAASYQSIAGTWGWTQIAGVNWASLAQNEATTFGKLLLLAALALYYAFCTRRLNLIGAMLNTVLVLFTVAPGLNVYYVMWLVPFALLANDCAGWRVFLAPAFLWLAAFYFNFNQVTFIPHAAYFNALAVLLWLLVIGWLAINLRRVPRPRVDPYLALLLFSTLFAIAPLLGPGYFWGAHDGRHSVYFLFEFDRVIQDGIFYPRWLPDFTFGYGYPFFNIYGPGAFYIGEALHLFGFDFVTATKIVFALAILLSGPAMFGFVKRLTGSSQAAFLSGLVYVYIPYHVADTYVRAALAESVALIFLPLALWGFCETVVNPRRTAIVAAAMAYSAMVFTHNGIALFFTPVLGIWVLFLMVGELRKKGGKAPVSTFIRFGLPSLAALGLGLGLAAVFVLPLALEFSFVRTDQWLANYYDYANHFVYLFQLFNPSWGYGISVPGPHDEMSFQLGVVPMLLAVFSLIAVARNPNGTRRFWIFFLAMTIIVVLLMLPMSLPLWEALRLVTFAQFPWRLLTLTTVSLAVLAGAIVATEPHNNAGGLSLPTLLLGLLILLGSYPYLTAQTQLEAKEGPVSILGLFRFQQSAGEMTGSTAWVQEIPTWSPMADVYFAGKKVKSKIDFTSFANPDDVWFGVDQTGKGLRANGERVFYRSQVDNLPIVFNIFYYPGWSAYLVDPSNNAIIRPLPLEAVGKLGRIQARVPKGEHWLMLRFDDTPPRIAGQWISALSVLLALGLLIWDVRVKRRSHVLSSS